MLAILDTVNKSLSVQLVENVLTSPDFIVIYGDHSSSGFIEGSNDGTLPSASTTSILSAPPSGSRRVVKSITIYNPNLTTITVYLKLVNSGNSRVIEKVTITALARYIFFGEAGTVGPSGSIGITGAVGPTSISDRIWFYQNFSGSL